MTLAGNWNYPTQMVFGAGALAKLPEKCAALGMKKPLLITDEGLKDSAIVSKSLDVMAAANMPAGLFAGVKGNPTGENVMAGVKAYKDGGYDGVVAFGGGSGFFKDRRQAKQGIKTRRQSRRGERGLGHQPTGADLVNGVGVAGLMIINGMGIGNQDRRPPGDQGFGHRRRPGTAD